MGEIFGSARLRDVIRIQRDGVALLHDAIRIEREAAPLLARSASAAGARAVATVVYVAPDAEARLDAVRAAGDFAASAWNGMLIARIIAADGATGRALVLAVLAVLRDGRPLPRVWAC